MDNLDKVYHFIAGLAIAVIVTVIMGNPLYGFVAGVAAGVAKEVYDHYDYGKGDFFDFFATVLGSFVGTIGVALVDKITGVLA